MQITMSEPVVRTTCRVLYGDTDAGGVVYYGNYLRFFEAGRTEFMRSLGHTYRDLEGTGIILPVIECAARYKASAAYDDLLIIDTSLVELKRVSCRFNCTIYRDDGNDRPTLLVKGYTVHAAVDRTGKLARLPEDLLALLREKTGLG